MHVAIGGNINKPNSILKKPIEVLYLDQLLPQAGGSIFRLVRIAMVRALEIDSGRPSLIEHPSSDKATTVALKEIVQGKVAYKAKGSVKEEKKTSNDVVQTTPEISLTELGI